MPTNPDVEDGVLDRLDAEIYEPPPIELMSEKEYGPDGREACVIYLAGQTPTPEMTEWIAATDGSFVDLEAVR